MTVEVTVSLSRDHVDVRCLIGIDDDPSVQIDDCNFGLVPETGDTTRSQLIALAGIFDRASRSIAARLHALPANEERAPRFIGSDTERQSVGDPGHCEACVEVGHVAAHPQLGCGDVGCLAEHGPDDGP